MAEEGNGGMHFAVATYTTMPKSLSPSPESVRFLHFPLVRPVGIIDRHSFNPQEFSFPLKNEMEFHIRNPQDFSGVYVSVLSTSCPYLVSNQLK